MTRRADARLEPDVDRRVTFDRAVWTKPLAFAADAVSSAMAVRSCGPRMCGACCAVTDVLIRTMTTSRRVPNRTCVGVDVDGRTDLRRMRVRARPAAAGEAEGVGHDVSWVTLAKSAWRKSCRPSVARRCASGRHSEDTATIAGGRAGDAAVRRVGVVRRQSPDDTEAGRGCGSARRGSRSSGCGRSVSVRRAAGSGGETRRRRA